MTTSLHSRIKVARKKAGQTQKELADAIFVSRVTISHWETGEASDIKLSNLKKLCRALNIRYEWLTKGTGEMIVVDHICMPNPEVLEDAIAALDKALKDKGLSPSSNKKAKLIMLIYAHYITSSIGSKETYVENLVALL